MTDRSVPDPISDSTPAKLHRDPSSPDSAKPRPELFYLLSELQGSASSVQDFNSRILFLAESIPYNLHQYLSIKIIIVFLFNNISSSVALWELFSRYLTAFFLFLKINSPHFLSTLQALTHQLISEVKLFIHAMIGLRLESNKVFILLICTELFQKSNKIPAQLVIFAVNNGNQRLSAITSTNSLPSVYSLMSSSISPFLPGFHLQEYTLVLDLDETLGHYFQGNFLVRPGVKEFVAEMSRYFELVLFTASTREYADWAMQRVDPEGSILLRLYREHTSEEHVKDLELLGRDIDRVIIIDNVEKSFEKHPRNGIIIKSWMGDQKDGELSSMVAPLSRICIDRQVSLYEIVALINRNAKR